MDEQMRIDLPCCNPGFGCPHCFCIKCWDDGKLPECSKIKDKPHIKTSLLCQHCIKSIKDICYSHYWSSLLDMREIKWEKLQDLEYVKKISCTFEKWRVKYERTENE